MSSNIILNNIYIKNMSDAKWINYINNIYQNKIKFNSSCQYLFNCDIKYSIWKYLLLCINFDLKHFKNIFIHVNKKFQAYNFINITPADYINLKQINIIHQLSDLSNDLSNSSDLLNNSNKLKMLNIENTLEKISIKIENIKLYHYCFQKYHVTSFKENFIKQYLRNYQIETKYNLPSLQYRCKRIITLINNRLK